MILVEGMQICLAALLFTMIISDAIWSTIEQQTRFQRIPAFHNQLTCVLLSLVISTQEGIKRSGRAWIAIARCTLGLCIMVSCVISVTDITGDMPVLESGTVFYEIINGSWSDRTVFQMIILWVAVVYGYSECFQILSVWELFETSLPLLSTKPLEETNEPNSLPTKKSRVIESMKHITHIAGICAFVLQVSIFTESILCLHSPILSITDNSCGLILAASVAEALQTASPSFSLLNIATFILLILGLVLSIINLFQEITMVERSLHWLNQASYEQAFNKSNTIYLSCCYRLSTTKENFQPVFVARIASCSVWDHYTHFLSVFVGSITTISFIITQVIRLS